MNNRTRLSTLCLIGATLVPVGSHATTERERLEICAEAVVLQVAPGRQFAVDYRNASPKIRARALDRRTEYVLSVSDPDGGRLVAESSCVVTARGKIVRLTLNGRRIRL